MRALHAARLAVLASVLASCSPTLHDGQFTCPDGRCPSGMSCGADAVCHVGADGSVSDAGPDARAEGGSGEGGMDAQGPDAGAPCTGTDGDGDGSCIPDDCDDGDPDVHPGAAELCAPGPSGGERDENCDGAIDEGCDWYFGTPHAVVRGLVPVTGVDVFGAAVTHDGLRMYYAVFGLPDLYTATRASTDVPFGSPSQVASAGGPVLSMAAVSITSDERSIYVQANESGGPTGIYTASRTRASDPFGPWMPVSVSTTLHQEAVHPSISADGTELFFADRADATSPSRIYRATGLGSTFGTPTEVTFPGVAPTDPLRFPRITEDGRTLFVTGPLGPSYAERTDGELTFGPLMPLAHFPSTTSHVFALYPTYLPETREMFFDGYSTDPLVTWAPYGNSIVRVQVCRDGPCPADTAVACPEAGSLFSPDHFHCYFQPTSTSFGFGGARDFCTGGSHLVSIDNEAEDTLAGANGWLGLNNLAPDHSETWSDGTPYVWHPAGFGMSTTVASAVLKTDAGWAWVATTTPSLPTCEREVWPSW